MIPDTEERLDPQEAYNRWRRQEYEGAAYKGPRMTSRHWVEGWTSPDGIHWKSVGKLGDMSSDGGSAGPIRSGYPKLFRIHQGRRDGTAGDRVDPH